MMTQNNIREVLGKHKVIPVVTFHSMDEVIPMASKLLDKGIHCMEVTLRTPIALEAIETLLRHTHGKMDIGVGTIVSEEQIEKCSNLNVKFMVSPGFNPNLCAAYLQSKIAFINGVTTPSDIMQAMSLGWDTFKFFPAHLFGGVDALKAYGQLFPDVKFCPTGGINKDTVAEYLGLKNVISVGGSWMTS